MTRLESYPTTDPGSPLPSAPAPLAREGPPKSLRNQGNLALFACQEKRERKLYRAFLLPGVVSWKVG